MSVLSLAIWITGILIFFSAGIALLPDGSSYPYPAEITTAITTIWQWMYSLNNIFPIDTFAEVLFYGVLVKLVTQYYWPTIDWLFKRIRGSDN